jgi:hypothetical protein
MTDLVESKLDSDINICAKIRVYISNKEDDN